MGESTTKDVSVCNNNNEHCKCSSKPSWAALLVVSLLNGLFLCGLHSVYHPYHDDRLLKSLTGRIDALKYSLAVAELRLMHLQQMNDGSVPPEAGNKQSFIRYKRSQLGTVYNSTPDGQDAALDIGTALFTALRSACRSKDKLCVPGPRGAPGIPGAKGVSGGEGAKGERGDDGLPGLPGVNGTDGSKGDKGVKGGLGQTGRSGRPGSKGDAGEPGSDGSPGATGLQGVPGLRGERGIPGLQGQIGNDGAKGNQGEKGEKGESGFIQVVSNQRQDSGKAHRNDTVTKGQIQHANSKQQNVSVSNVDIHQACNSDQYNMLKDSWRRESVIFKGECPWQYNVFQHGWYRFSKQLGGMIKTRCPQKNGCRAVAPGWMKGRHPTEIGVLASRLVCFSLDDDCCMRSVRVDVVNCGDYYVYNLPEIPTCYYEYCGNAY